MSSVNGTTTTSLASILNAATDAQSNKTSTTLASALSSKSSSTTTTSTDKGITDTITLSDAAKALLNASTKKNYGYTLTKAQQDQIKTVLDKYKNAELTNANYTKIQADLKKLKLDTATLAIKDRASSFSPMRSFLAILRGKTPEQLGTESTAAQQTKKKLFEAQLVNDWKALAATTT